MGATNVAVGFHFRTGSAGFAYRPFRLAPRADAASGREGDASLDGAVSELAGPAR